MCLFYKAVHREEEKKYKYVHIMFFSCYKLSREQTFSCYKKAKKVHGLAVVARGAVGKRRR